MNLPRAVDQNNREEVERLLRSGSDVNEKDWPCPDTALIRAAWWGRTELADLLIRCIADVNVKNNAGWTADNGSVFWAYRDGGPID